MPHKKFNNAHIIWLQAVFYLQGEGKHWWRGIYLLLELINNHPMAAQHYLMVDQETMKKIHIRLLLVVIRLYKIV